MSQSKNRVMVMIKSIRCTCVERKPTNCQTQTDVNIDKVELGVPPPIIYTLCTLFTIRLSDHFYTTLKLGR